MIRFSSLFSSERAILCKKVFTQAAAARILTERLFTVISHQLSVISYGRRTVDC